MEGEVEKKIKHLEGIIRETPSELLQDRVYTCVANLCILLTAYKREKGAAGWSSKIFTDLDEPMLNSEQQKMVEESFSKAPWIMDLLNEDFMKARSPSPPLSTRRTWRPASPTWGGS